MSTAESKLALSRYQESRKDVTRIWKVLSHPMAREIYKAAFDKYPDELAHFDIVQKYDMVTKANITPICKRLVQVGLLKDRQEGINVFYTTIPGGLRKLVEYMESVKG